MYMLMLIIDIVNRDGTGSTSIYGEYFDDESYGVSHDKPGVLGMANRGSAHTNGCQFYITTKPLKCFDTRSVAFGYVPRIQPMSLSCSIVIDGFRVLHAMNDAPLTTRQRPIDDIVVSKCGK